MELMAIYAESILEDDQDVLRYLFEQKMDIQPEAARKYFGLASGFNLSMAIRCEEDSFMRRCYARTLTHNRTPIYAAGFDHSWQNLHPQKGFRQQETIDVDLVFEELRDAQFLIRCKKSIELMSESFYVIGHIREAECASLDVGRPVIKLSLLVRDSQWKV